jgi:hypothetical protein
LGELTGRRVVVSDEAYGDEPDAGAAPNRFRASGNGG